VIAIENVRLFEAEQQGLRSTFRNPLAQTGTYTRDRPRGRFREKFPEARTDCQPRQAANQLRRRVGADSA
jgi:hypothetical protein